MNGRYFSIFLALFLGSVATWQQVRSAAPSITVNLPAKATIKLNNNDTLNGVTLTRIDPKKKRIFFTQGNNEKTLTAENTKKITLHGETRISGGAEVIIVIQGGDLSKCSSEFSVPLRLEHLQWQKNQQIKIDLSNYADAESLIQAKLSYVLTKLEFADGDLHQARLKRC